MAFQILDAEFSATPTEGVARLDVQFTDESVVYDLLVESGQADDKIVESGQASDMVIETGV